MHQLTVADGLSSNTVQCLAQDRQGFLWIGTQDGLSRYDGRHLRTFRANARRLGSLPSNYVRALAADPRRGGLWVGTGNGLSYYDPRTECFSSVVAEAGKTYFVNALLADPLGGVWVGTEEGLWYLASATQRLRRYRPVLGKMPLSTGRYAAIRALGRDAAGTLWAGTGEGQLCRFDPASGQLRLVPGGWSGRLAPSLVLAAAPAGGMWAGAEDGTLRYLRPGQPPTELLPAGGPAVRSLWADARGGVWVGTMAGLRYLTTAPGQNRVSLVGQLPGPVLALAPDRAGQLWVGTETGLRALDLRPSPFARPGGAAVGPVWALVTTPARLWLGTERYGLLGLDPRTGAVAEHLLHQPTSPASLADNYVRCVLAEPGGGLWVGTQHQGLDYRPAGAAGFRHFRHGVGDTGSLADDFVRCLYRDPLDGALWVGTEGGLARLARPDSDRFASYRQQANDPGGLPSNYVRCVLRDWAGQLWVGTGGGGLCRLDDPRTGRFTTFRANARAEFSLPSNFVRALCLDATGRLWVGTEGGGLCRLDDARTGHFTTFGEAQGFPNDVVYGLLPDQATRTLWASTNRGLARLDPATGQLTTFDTRDGLPQDEYNAGAACVGPSGQLYFGGPIGAVSFQAAALRPPPAPPVVLTGLRRLNQAVGLPDTAVGLRRLLHLYPRDYVFTLEFVALDLRRADRARLRYRLDGFDRDWLTASSQGEATYTNLDPGHYTFRVRAAGAPASAEATLRLVVAPPWYGTWWFRVLVASCLGLVGWLAYRLRVRQLLALEGVRHRIARDLHDDMGSTLSSISILSALAQRQQSDGHPTQVAELLGRISESSRRMLDAMDDIVWAIDPAYDSLSDVMARMRALAADLLEARGIRLVFAADPAVAALRLTTDDRREFFLFYKEALHNLAKYAHCQQADVALTYAPGWLELLVADDGVGFEPAAAPRGSGHGLPNLRARAAALGGQLSLTTAPGQGTVVRLRIPL